MFTPALQAATTIDISGTVVVPSAKRMGVNIGNHDFYDSGQMLKNLVNMNPGFEPQLYQSVIPCASGGGNTCTDDLTYDVYPNGFWNNGTYRVLGSGQTGAISASQTPTPYGNTTFTLSGNPGIHAGSDYIVVTQQFAGIPAPATVNTGNQPVPVNGWWVINQGGTYSADANPADQAPGSAGVQCLKMDATSGTLWVRGGFDSVPGRAFVQMNGSWQLSFKAKLISGSNQLQAKVERNSTYLNQVVTLTSSWQTFTLPFTANETGSTIGTAWASLIVSNAAVLVDDVSLTPVGGDGTNTTTFGDAVVSTLRTLQPGVLRYWDVQLGDSLDNAIAPEFGRKPTGFINAFLGGTGGQTQIGLHEFLQLCELIGADPWYVVPTNWTGQDMKNLMEYLGGPAGTHYGDIRIARGHATPWTTSFNKIHLEFGNENWNSAFAGGVIRGIVAYAQYSSQCFGAAKTSPYYVPGKFNMIMGGQAVNSGVATDESNNSTQHDSYAVAPYIVPNAIDGTDEQLFGAAFAEAQWWASPSGYQGQNLAALKASSHPSALVDYEENMQAVSGLSQNTVNAFLPSLGAGLSMATVMLTQLRDAGIIYQNLWQLPQYNFSFAGQTQPIWGIVVDMGVTNRRRPQFLAEQLINQAIGSGANVMRTTQSGDNPTWNGTFNDGAAHSVPNAPYIESFAFSNGSVILLNLSRSSSQSLPVTFSGVGAPHGSLVMHRLTSASLRDTNENSNSVVISSAAIPNFDPTQPYTLPPYSMTVLTPGAVSGNPTPSITLTKSASPTSVVSGNIVTFTIQYQNNGAGPAANVVVTDAVPAGSTLSSIGQGGTAANGTITWNVGTVNAGASGTVSFQVTAQ